MALKTAITGAVVALVMVGVGAAGESPAGGAAALGRARELLAKDQLEEAATILTVTVRDGATRVESLILLTQLETARGEHEKAVRWGKQAVEAAPASAEAHYRLAVALRDHMTKISKLKALGVLGEYKEALARALELDGAHVEARAERIGFLINAPGIAGGDRAKARSEIDILLSTDVRRGTAMKALLHRVEGDEAGAIAILKEHLARHPDDHENRLFLALLLQNAKRFQEADAQLEPLLAAESANLALNATYQLARGRVLGGYDQRRAVALLESYLQRRPQWGRALPSRAVAYWRLGLAHQQLGELDRARAALEKALALEPDNQEVAKALKALPR